MAIGEKIVELRKKYNLTQEKLSEKVGVSRQTVSNWESNITNPDLLQASKITQIFKVSLDELIDNDLEIVCKDNSSDNLLEALVGKVCYLNIDDDYDLYLNYDVPVKVLEVNSDFIKIEYSRKKEKCVKLIDIDLIISIKEVIEEEI